MYNSEYFVLSMFLNWNSAPATKKVAFSSMSDQLNSYLYKVIHNTYVPYLGSRKRSLESEQDCHRQTVRLRFFLLLALPP
jgi:hypothetical protein